MATYKVIQDIEAEDKLVGPLSLRQFIYAGIAVVNIFIAFKLAFVSIFLIAPFLPIIILFGLLAVPFGHDQPSEVWLLAKFKFYIKSHKRTWSKEGGNKLVTITVPKVTQVQLTKNFSGIEAQSRLQALANTIDSRGWAIKNVNVNLSNQAPQQTTIDTQTDRLVEASSLPQDVPPIDITAADDIMDASNNPTAQQLDKMMVDSAEKNKQKVIANMTNPKPEPKSKSKKNSDYWFLNDAAGKPEAQPAGYTKFSSDKVVTPGSEEALFESPKETEDDEKLLEEIEKKKKAGDIGNSHLHVIEPLSQKKAKKPKTTTSGKVTPTPDPAILKLALANKDNWSVATIASQAQKAKQKESPQDEVVISLH
jgi:hypothetical protein